MNKSAICLVVGCATLYGPIQIANAAGGDEIRACNEIFSLTTLRNVYWQVRSNSRQSGGQICSSSQSPLDALSTSKICGSYSEALSSSDQVFSLTERIPDEAFAAYRSCIAALGSKELKVHINQFDFTPADWGCHDGRGGGWPRYTFSLSFDWTPRRDQPNESKAFLSATNQDEQFLTCRLKSENLPDNQSFWLPFDIKGQVPHVAQCDAVISMKPSVLTLTVGHVPAPGFQLYFPRRGEFTGRTCPRKN